MSFQATGRIPIVLVLLTLAGCRSFIIDSQAELIRDASPAVEGHWDYELIGDAIPYSIVQLEGLVALAPDNEILLQTLIQNYVSYAYGWVEDEIDRASRRDMERISALELRARHLHLRGRHFALQWMHERDDAFPDPRSVRLEAFQQLLQERFTDKEDAPALFWLGFSWGAAINVSRDDLILVADLGHAKALVERSQELDPDYYFCGAANFLATVSSSLSPAMGGDLERGQRLFEGCLETTERKVLLVHYNYARTFAVQTQDRELFESLLREVIDAPDLGDATRLQNKLARRRAARLLPRASELFL